MLGSAGVPGGGWQTKGQGAGALGSSVQQTTLQTRKQDTGGRAVDFPLTQPVSGWIQIHTQAWTPRLWETYSLGVQSVV